MSHLFTYNALLVMAGTGLLGAVSGLIGSFAVLRKQSLAGDTYAHAALPGLWIAFLLAGERSLPVLLIGAFLSGLLGLMIVSLITKYTKIKTDAALGIILSTFFGLGIAISGIAQKRLLTASKAGLDSYILGKTAGIIASDVYLIAAIGLLCLVTILFLFKEFNVLCFDTDFAKSQGWPVLFLDFVLLMLLGLVVVTGLPVVGVVMMAALLILPAVTARFWTERLAIMMPVSAGFGVLIGLVGTLLSAEFAYLPAGPIIVLSGTVLFLISAIFAPRRGWLARLRQRMNVDFAGTVVEWKPETP